MVSEKVIHSSLLLEFPTHAMATIFPFRALRYDTGSIALGDVVTQPYDKITPEMQARYYNASPFNLVRIILGKKTGSDDAKNNVYTRAATFFQQWRGDGVLRQDPEPSIYAYSQIFNMPGVEKSVTKERRGFIALGKIEDYGERIVFRHEQTLAKPKADRLELLRATRAHFGQLFMLYSDPRHELDKLLQDSGNDPDAEVKDEHGVAHRIRRISDRKTLEAIATQMRDKKLIIADGHHRYETALAYRNERRELANSVAASAGGVSSLPRKSPVTTTGQNSDVPHEYVMMTFINMHDESLVILPTHRVVHGLPAFQTKTLIDGASKYFEVEKLGTVNSEVATSVLREAGKKGTALLAITSSEVLLLRRRPGANASALSGFSKRQQQLDVVQLHKLILEGVLGISEEAIRNQQNISYVRDANEALERVRQGANVAFLMNPVRIEQVRDIAFAGEVLPQKSTDFYPKLLSGLTMYALD